MLIKIPAIITKLYFPGLISLLALPFLLIVFFVNHGWLQRNRCMEFITLSNENMIDIDNLKQPYKSYLHNNRFYTPLFFTGEKNHDVFEQKQLTFLLSSLISKKDTMNGICVKLDNKSKYSDLVYVIDACYQLQDEHIVYLFYNNTFHIMYVSELISPTPAMPL